MVEKKVTIMVLKVNLQCCRCYKKVKKILCKFPQIQDQVYDEKQNTVTITVVCCSPEKIKQKIICKGGESIKSIEIKVPQKPANPPKETNQEKDPPAAAPGKPNASDQPKKPNPPDSKGEPGIIVVPPPPVEVPVDPFRRTCCRECYEGRSGGPCFYGGHGWPPPCYHATDQPKKPNPPEVPVDPFRRTCCRECSEGRSGGPCFYGGHGWPPPCYQYDGYVGWPVYDSYGGGRCRCYLVCEENSGPSCRIM